MNHPSHVRRIPRAEIAPFRAASPGLTDYQICARFGAVHVGSSGDPKGTDGYAYFHVIGLPRPGLPGEFVSDGFAGLEEAVGTEEADAVLEAEYLDSEGVLCRSKMRDVPGGSALSVVDLAPHAFS